MRNCLLELPNLTGDAERSGSRRPIYAFRHQHGLPCDYVLEIDRNGQGRMAHVSSVVDEDLLSVALDGVQGSREVTGQ